MYPPRYTYCRLGNQGSVTYNFTRLVAACYKV